jgi:hypothetical protein
MSLWGLATCGAQPHKAWLMAWFLSSRASIERASTQVSAICAYYSGGGSAGYVCMQTKWTYT